MFERFNITRTHFPSIEHNFRPVHYSSLLTAAGSLVPFSTAALRKNFFEQQRELARLHGITIGTSHGVIDNLLAELSNSLLPQCFMNMVASEGTHSNLVEFSRNLWRELWIRNGHLHSEGLHEILKKSNIPIPSEDLIFDNKWGRMVEECHHELLNNQKCFDIPWAVLHFDDGMKKAFSSFDKWPIIASLLKTDQNPIVSQNSNEARKNVLVVYKKLQRSVKRYWWDFALWDIPIPVFREVLKNQFTKNAHITDARIVDRKVDECKQHMVAMKFYYYNEYHVRNMLFAENIEPKPKDFLSKFLHGKE
ncbi:hypothetical protein GPALN_005369 [Globodera pallida]|nr:hypothetical protein GPALN_005369 [Globodera pallida]